MAHQADLNAMRVVHVISNLGLGGAETMLVRLIREQAGGTVEHAVISFLPGGVYAQTLRDLGVEVIELEGTRSLRSAALLRPLGAALARARPDLVQGWMYHGNVAASLAAIVGLCRAPVLWGIRQTLERLGDNRPLTRGVILAGSALGFQPRRIVYNSTLAAEQHEAFRYPKSKRVTIYNGVDTRRFRTDAALRLSARAGLGLPPDAEVIGRVARNDPMKDHATLFQAFELLAARRPACIWLWSAPAWRRRTGSLRSWRSSPARPSACSSWGRGASWRSWFRRSMSPCPARACRRAFRTCWPRPWPAACPPSPPTSARPRPSSAIPARLVPRLDPGALAAAVGAVLDLSPEQRQEMGRQDRERIVARFEIGAAAAQFEAVWREVRGGGAVGCATRSLSPFFMGRGLG